MKLQDLRVLAWPSLRWAVRLGIGVKPKSETPTLQLSFSASFPLTRLLRAFYSVEKR